MAYMAVVDTTAAQPGTKPAQQKTPPDDPWQGRNAYGSVAPAR